MNCHCPLTELYSTLRIVLCNILKRLQLAWVPLGSPQHARDTALTDSYFRRETCCPFCLTVCVAIPSSTSINVSLSFAVFGLRDVLASAAEPIPLNFSRCFAMVNGYLCPMRCTEHTRYMTGYFTNSQ